MRVNRVIWLLTTKGKTKGYNKRIECGLYLRALKLGRRGAVVKGVEHGSIIVLVNIWVARVRVPLVLSVGIWICKNSIINT